MDKFGSVFDRMDMKLGSKRLNSNSPQATTSI